MEDDMDISETENKNISASVNSSSGANGSFVYDQRGALWYVIVVILVYSLSMFFLIATLVRRGSRNKTTDRDVNKYLKGLGPARQQAKREKVLRVRLQWPGNFITPRYGIRHSGTNPTTSSTDPQKKEADAFDEISYHELANHDVITPEIRIHGHHRMGRDSESAGADDESARGGQLTGSSGYLLLNEIDQDSTEHSLPKCSNLETPRVFRTSSTRERRYGIVDRPKIVMGRDRLNAGNSEPNLFSVFQGLRGISESSLYSVHINSSAPSIYSNHLLPFTTSSSLTSIGSQLSDDLNFSDMEGTEICYDTETSICEQ